MWTGPHTTGSELVTREQNEKEKNLRARNLFTAGRYLPPLKKNELREKGRT